MYSITVHLDNGNTILLPHKDNFITNKITDSFHNKEVVQYTSKDTAYMIDFSKVTHLEINKIR